MQQSSSKTIESTGCEIFVTVSIDNISTNLGYEWNILTTLTTLSAQTFKLFNFRVEQTEPTERVSDKESEKMCDTETT